MYTEESPTTPAAGQDVSLRKCLDRRFTDRTRPRAIVLLRGSSSAPKSIEQYQQEFNFSLRELRATLSQLEECGYLADDVSRSRIPREITYTITSLGEQLLNLLAEDQA